MHKNTNQIDLISSSFIGETLASWVIDANRDGEDRDEAETEIESTKKSSEIRSRGRSKPERSHERTIYIFDSGESDKKKRVLFFFSDAVRRSKETYELVRIYRWPWRFIGMVFKLGSTKAHINVHEKGINCVFGLSLPGPQSRVLISSSNCYILISSSYKCSNILVLYIYFYNSLGISLDM